jgi:hypothetical protein
VIDKERRDDERERMRKLPPTERQEPPEGIDEPAEPKTRTDEPLQI